MNQAHYSVVIVGAGPTGLILANFLGQYGIRTALIERLPEHGGRAARRVDR
jgi:3-(3-hydroxy-phenyl)propionate hydroxylase